MTGKRGPVIYLDHAATTPVDPRVLEAMLPFFTERFGNASAGYGLGVASLAALNEARATVAEIIGANPNEIVFTSGASEATNTALKGVALAARRADRHCHIVTAAAEHRATLGVAEELSRAGFAVSVVDVDEHAQATAPAIEAALRPETAVVSLTIANNEVGTINPIADIAAICRERGALLHVDAAQAVGLLPLDVDELGADLMSISAHKFYGPKGVGVLYVRGGTELAPLIHGGGQESGLRAGTENIPGIVGLAAAMEIADDQRVEYGDHCARLRDRLIEGVLTAIPDSRLNGHRVARLPNNAHFTFEGIEGARTTEGLLALLDQRGVCAATGSACSARSLEPSHVLRAMGLSEAQAHSSLRFTVGRANTGDEIEQVLALLSDLVARRRMLSRPARQRSGR